MESVIVRRHGELLHCHQNGARYVQSYCGATVECACGACYLMMRKDMHLERVILLQPKSITSVSRGNMTMLICDHYVWDIIESGRRVKLMMPAG